MTIEYKIYPEERLIHAEIIGRVTVDDHVRHFEVLSRDPEYISPMRKIVDFRKCDDYAVDAEGERFIAAAKAHYDAVFADEHCAIVAPVSWIFGMNRIYEAVSRGGAVTTGVFRTMSEACRWLGIDPSCSACSDIVGSPAEARETTA